MKQLSRYGLQTVLDDIAILHPALLPSPSSSPKAQLEPSDFSSPVSAQCNPRRYGWQRLRHLQLSYCLLPGMQDEIKVAEKLQKPGAYGEGNTTTEHSDTFWSGREHGNDPSGIVFMQATLGGGVLLC